MLMSLVIFTTWEKSSYPKFLVSKTLGSSTLHAPSLSLQFPVYLSLPSPWTCCKAKLEALQKCHGIHTHKGNKDGENGRKEGSGGSTLGLT